MARLALESSIVAIACDPTHDVDLLQRAARRGIRGHGGAEPNPLVGCVIADAEGCIIAEGHHAYCGGPHAEVVALDCAGERARGGTAWVTLEPCSHQGRTGPCTRALIDAGIARVVIGRRDPTAQAGGGAEVLHAAGVEVDVLDDAACFELAAPFVHRAATGLPWVVCKWAQTIDGYIATSSGQSKWISSGRSRRLVHRERGRVDAIMVGVGTVVADDPQLTVRDATPRRTPMRILVDPTLRAPADARVFDDSAPTWTIHARNNSPTDDRAAIGSDLLDDGTIDLRQALRDLSGRGVATLLVEGGAGLFTTLFAQGLVNEAWVFTAPRLMRDADALAPLSGSHADAINAGTVLRLVDLRHRDGDVVARYRLSDQS